MSSLNEMVEAVKAVNEYLSDLAWDALIDDAPDTWPSDWDPILDGARWTTVEPPVVEEHKPELSTYEPSQADRRAAVELFIDMDEELFDAWVAAREADQDHASMNDNPMW